MKESFMGRGGEGNRHEIIFKGPFRGTMACPPAEWSATLSGLTGQLAPGLIRSGACGRPFFPPYVEAGFVEESSSADAINAL